MTFFILMEEGALRQLKLAEGRQHDQRWQRAVDMLTCAGLAPESSSGVECLLH